MWPWNSDGRLASRIRALEARVLELEERDLEHRLQMLDTAERVATKLQDRVRHRRKAESDQEPQPDPADLLRAARARYNGGA